VGGAALSFALPKLHRQRGGLAFADGHAEAHHWLDPRTTSFK
jgi:prepilin-type processing-associated H-X9-DG protein